MRIVIELKRGEIPDIVLNNLYKNHAAAGQLRDEHGGAGRPASARLNLKDFSSSSSSHRREVVTRRTI